VTKNDIELMPWMLKCFFFSNDIEKDIEILDNLLKFEKGDNAYYEAQLKYCNYYLQF
jgi:hypothetical protein